MTKSVSRSWRPEGLKTKQSKIRVIAVPGGEGKDNVTWNIWKNNGKEFPKFGLKKPLDLTGSDTSPAKQGK